MLMQRQGFLWEDPDARGDSAPGEAEAAITQGDTRRGREGGPEELRSRTQAAGPGSASGIREGLLGGAGLKTVTSTWK